nr:Smr/MutS family protein [Bacillota bacterium]
EEALVQVGAMKVTVPVADLGRWQEEEAGKPDRERRGGYTVQKEGSVSPQIDLRGQTLDEALQAVEKFLDDALWAGLSRVTVIHGRGTGRLQEGLRRYFQEQPLVKSWRRGLPNEGGDGVTILEL